MHQKVFLAASVYKLYQEMIKGVENDGIITLSSI